MRASVRDSRGSFMFPRYLRYLLTDFCQTFVTGASRDRDELIRFWGQKVKGQGHSMTKCIPDFHVFTISPVSVDGFSPNFCHCCILGHRWPDYIFGSKGQSSRSHYRATFSSFFLFRFMFLQCSACMLSLYVTVAVISGDFRRLATWSSWTSWMCRRTSWRIYRKKLETFRFWPTSISPWTSLNDFQTPSASHISLSYSCSYAAWPLFLQSRWKIFSIS